MNPPFTPAYKFAMWLVPIGFFLNFLEFHGNGLMACKSCSSGWSLFFNNCMVTLFLTAIDSFMAIMYFLLHLSNNLQSWPNFYQIYLRIHPTGNYIYIGTVFIVVAMVIGQAVPERQTS